MYKKRILPVCVALALGSGNVGAKDLSDYEAECSSNISEVSKKQKGQLSETCQKGDSFLNENWEWVAGSLVAMSAAASIVFHHDHGALFANKTSDTLPDSDSVPDPDPISGPVPEPAPGPDPLPEPDPIPDPNPIPEPDPVPDPNPFPKPDPVPGPDPIPKPDPVPDPVPDPDPLPAPYTKVFNNGVTLDTAEKTLTFDTVTFNDKQWSHVTFRYVEAGDSYLLTAPDGYTLTVNKYSVTRDENALMEGRQGSEGHYWKYDSRGQFWFASDATSVIRGDGQSHTLNEDTHAAGKGHIGTLVSGDGTLNTLNGDTIASDGAIGTVITGDDTTSALNGHIYASEGATGLDVSGNRTAITNNGSITAVDENSVGVLVSGDNTTFSHTGIIDSSDNGTGVSIRGNDATLVLDGKINVHTVKAQVGSYSGATGVSIIGDRANTLITGEIALSGENTDLATEVETSSTLRGLSISGDDNRITLDGALKLDVDGALFRTEGILVSGSGNHVQINGGVDINVTQSSEDNLYSNVAIAVAGDNTVSLSGHSMANLSGMANSRAMMGYVTDGGAININADATLDLSFTASNRGHYDTYAYLSAEGNGSVIDNRGEIMLSGESSVMIAHSGAAISNGGRIMASSPPIFAASGLLVADDAGSVATNRSGGMIVLTSEGHPQTSSGQSQYPLKWYAGAAYALLATNNAYVENQAGGTVQLNGAGLYGMAAERGYADNAGTINLDGFTPTVDENGNMTGKTFWQDSKLYTMSAGVIVGSTDSGGNAHATSLNTGVINVNNEGFGMMALYGGIVTNEGTINLTADDGIMASASHQLIGMGVFNNGIAVNGQTGVLNINADYGQAFYNDGSGLIVNYGKINLNGSEMATTDSHMGALASNETILPHIITSAGQLKTWDSATGFVSLIQGGANYGKATLRGDLKTMNWLWNEGADSTLNVNGDITVTLGLENEGTLAANTVTTGNNVYNRAGATLTLETLSAPQFFNEGHFSGTATTPGSYTSNLVNSGTMNIAQDGHAVFSGTASLYNQTGARITNSAHTLAGGENTLLHITRTGHADTTLVNDGLLLAQNGYSAITADQSSTNDAHEWFTNTESGVIGGISPESPLVQMGRGYNFANKGTVTIQGDNAVAIAGGVTSYTQYLVNSGTLNVGTEAGKAEGSNGTGLIGMMGHGKGTVVNNAASGVINVYADDSYAFGGNAKQFINNGTVNLFCDSGCGLYAPGTIGKRDDPGVADIIVPPAATAPAQGKVPTPPADPVMQTLSHYTVGTHADGSAGVLNASHVQLSHFSVDTGFTAGTDATTVTFDNVVTGNHIQGADTLTSTSVVWNAKGSTDREGNVDITLTKNAYADVATDRSVGSVADALDAGYNSNELYTSLNVSSPSELNNALKQINGSQATRVAKEARLLSNRFTMLADTAPTLGNGLAMNLVAKGDPRAEMGKNTQYDMLALRQTLDLTEHQALSMEYGIARVEGNGSKMAGDNGVTGGNSQFFGLKHHMAFEDGLSWDNALRFDIHNLDSNRAMTYGNVNKSAESNIRQQYLELRSTGAKKIDLSDTLTVTPYAGVKLRHTREDGYQERNAGDFNLNMSAGSETALDSLVGVTVDYAGTNGWSATATLEGGPNLRYAKSQRRASLAGTGNQSFTLNTDQDGGGINSLAKVGVKYDVKGSVMQLEAYEWKEDGVSDKGLMMNYTLTF